MSASRPAANSKVSRAPNLTEQVTTVLREEITSGARALGEALPSEQAMSEAFGVSRTVMREAISRLKAEGYVHSRQGAGAFVMARPGLESFRLAGRGEAASDDVTADIFELRYIVETAAAALAARRRTRDDLAAMREALVTMGARLACRGDGTQADDDFHIAIAAATGNPMIQRFARFMGNQFYDSRVPTWNEEGHAQGRARDAQDEHQRIFDAIAAGDPVAAHEAARNHLLQAALRLGLKTDHWDKEIRG